MRRLISLVVSFLLLSSVGYADPPQPPQEQIVGGYYQSATPTYASGLRVPLNFDINGNLKITCIVGCSGTTLGQTTMALSLPVTMASNQSNINVNCTVGCAGGTFNNNADAVATSATNGQAAAWLYGWNGASWDRLQVDGSKNLDINCVVGCAGGTFNNNADTVATSASNGQSASWPYVWNGSSWDRLYGDKTNGAFVNVKTSVLPTGAATATGLSTINTTLGSPMQNSGGSVTANQGGTWTVQPGNTANTTAWKVDGSAVTQPVSGTVTANAGTNLNTSALALEAGGNLAQLVTDSGAPGATACATDTSSCNFNQLLQRLAQRLTTINTTLGSPFQAGGALAANQSVNVAQINGVTPLMGNGGTGTGSHRTTLSNDNTAIANWGQGATGAAVPSGAQYIGGNGSGNTTGITVCDNYTPFSFSSSSAQKIVSKVSAKKVYICSINIVAAAATNVALIEGTKVTNECDTSTAGMAGGTTAATGWNFAANGGLTLGSGVGVVAKAANANFDVCLLASAANQVSGGMAWTQY